MKKRSLLRKLLTKTAALVCVWSLLLQIPVTYSYFSDTEISEDNFFKSGSLDLEIQNVNFTINSILPGEEATGSATFANVGTHTFSYTQGYGEEANPLCEVLVVDVTKNGAPFYNGFLKDFLVTNSGLLNSTESDLYSYDISLPPGTSDDFANLECNLYVESLAHQPENPPAPIGFWDTEKFQIIVRSADWQDCRFVTGKKLNAVDNSGIANWEIIVHSLENTPIDSFIISANDSDGEFTSPLLSGRKYLFEVSGTWENGEDQKVDANFFSEDDWGTIGDYDTDDARDDKQLDLLVNDEDRDWGTYNPEHTYTLVYDGQDAPVNLKIYDADQDLVPPSWYSDNVGGLTVKIYDVTNEIVTTNESGDYEKEICGFGDFQILEVPQQGWTQISPERPSYYHISPLELSGDERFDFINVPDEVDIPENPDVVINEVMWMGSSVSTSDEWIELRNMTGNPIDISGWKIYGATSEVGGYLEIPNTGSCRVGTCIVPAYGYFLVANYYEDNSSSDLNVFVDFRETDISLHNTYSTNGSLILTDENDTVIDATPVADSTQWPAGVNITGDDDIHQSMERNLVPGDGTDPANWHTCIDPACNDGTYWDTAEGPNYGTPKDANHSVNDSSLHTFVEENLGTVEEDGATSSAQVADEGSGGPQPKETETNPTSTETSTPAHSTPPLEEGSTPPKEVIVVTGSEVVELV